MPWPIYFPQNLTISSNKSPVGIATLWTQKEKILEKIPKQYFYVGGQLYSKAGINFIIRNILANPTITKLIICGLDKSGSGDALINLQQNGIDNDYNIIGSENARIHREIPKDSIETFRQNVEVIDMRKKLNIAEIKKINQNASIPRPFTISQIFPEAEHTAPDYFPSEKIAIRLEAKTVAIVWLKALEHIIRFGYVRASHYSKRQKELINLNTIITDEDPDNIFFAPWYPFSQNDYKNYLPQIMTAKEIPEVSYTYGQRLRNHNGINQIQESIIRRLKSEEFSRRAVAVTWDVAIDTYNEHCPCLDLIQCLVQGKKMYMICYMRSNDMYRAYPLNALAFRAMQKEIARAVDLEMGYLNIISASAHIYDENFEEIQNLLEKYKHHIPKCEWDPRGNFIIETKNNSIVVTHQSPEGIELDRIEGKTAMDVYNKINKKLGISLIGHALDIGAQLQNAETAIKLNIPFTQDMPLNFDELKNE